MAGAAGKGLGLNYIWYDLVMNELELLRGLLER